MHGDDYVSSGGSEDLDWLESELGKIYQIMTQRTKPIRGKGYVEARILNIIVRRTDAGYEMEADPRHAELIVEQVTKDGARTATTPGNGMPKEGENEKGTRRRAGNPVPGTGCEM